jgi:hypothetical protein
MQDCRISMDLCAGLAFCAMMIAYGLMMQGYVQLHAEIALLGLGTTMIYPILLATGSMAACPIQGTIARSVYRLS